MVHEPFLSLGTALLPLQAQFAIMTMSNSLNSLHYLLSPWTSLRKMTDKFRSIGPAVRIGPNAVLTTDYKHCQKTEAHKSQYRKGPWDGTFRFQKGVDHSFSMMDEAKHTATRTKVGPGYSGTLLVVRLSLTVTIQLESRPIVIVHSFCNLP